ncbi:MAG: DUF86 domain-containing protein [Planctomycetota bacterium]
MTPGEIDAQVVTQRALWIREMLEALRELPLAERQVFLQHRNTAAAAESYLRRALEALFDIGRHILAKKFAHPAAEYKEIVEGLLQRGVLEASTAALMRKMAGYRNRMVHFYQEISPEELWEIGSRHLTDIELVLSTLLQWIKAQPGHSGPESTAR